MLGDSQARELLGFLTLDTRPDVKSQATQYVLSLTGSADGRRFLASNAEVLRALLTLRRDVSPAVAKDCHCALVNLSADESVHAPLLRQADLLPSLLSSLCDPDHDFADQACSILCNLSRREDSGREVLRAIQNEEVGLAKIVEIFCTDHYSKKGTLHYLGPLLSNLTQLPEARQFILDKDRCVVQRLLPYTQYEGSGVRRGGVVGTLRNCCFDYAYHEWLLGSDVDILPFLLLPLAGPEELSEDETEGLPVDLQYLPEDKRREEDPDIRRMLLEAINLPHGKMTLVLCDFAYGTNDQFSSRLCLWSLYVLPTTMWISSGRSGFKDPQLVATKNGRKVVRDKNTYVILRELHKWEKEPDVVAACEKLIEVLISDEPEGGMENLLEVKIPEDVERTLRRQDEEEQRRLEGEPLKTGEGASGERSEALER